MHHLVDLLNKFGGARRHQRRALEAAVADERAQAASAARALAQSAIDNVLLGLELHVRRRVEATMAMLDLAHCQRLTDAASKLSFVQLRKRELPSSPVAVLGSPEPDSWECVVAENLVRSLRVAGYQVCVSFQCVNLTH
jgi:hypothetical protein